MYDTVALIGAALSGVGANLLAALNDGFAAIASAIAAGNLNLTDAGSVKALIQSVAEARGVTLAQGVSESVAAIIVASNAALDQAGQAHPSGQSLLDAVADIELAIQGAASNAIEAAAGDRNSLATIDDAFTGSNLSAMIALAGSHLADQGQNQAPIAFNALATTDEDTTVTHHLTGTDIDLGPLTYNVVTAPNPRHSCPRWRSLRLHPCRRLQRNRFIYVQRK